MAIFPAGGDPRGIDRRELVFVLRVAVWSGALPVVVRALPLPWVASRVRRGPRIPVALPTPRRIVRLTDRVLGLHRGPWRANCLVRSLVLSRYLPRTGMPVALHVGVRPGGDTFDGHAWLTSEGLPVAETDDPTTRYTETWRYPAAEPS